jgi:opacity protein-like surface antigen
MKKLLFLLCGWIVLAPAAFAQQYEGVRQDINLSFMGVFQPYLSGTGKLPTKQNSTVGTGLYLGYRYLLTPSNAIEANYSYSHFTDKFVNSSASARVHTGMQEATAAFVHTFFYKRFNPFLEIGGGMLFFTPNGERSTSYDTEYTHTTAVLFGGGIAYELSPSWDLRVQYRGFLLKPTNFGLKNPPNDFTIDRRYVMSMPAVGFAYHF